MPVQPAKLVSRRRDGRAQNDATNLIPPPHDFSTNERSSSPTGQISPAAFGSPQRKILTPLKVPI
jgi:hypothetical protein